MTHAKPTQGQHLAELIKAAGLNNTSLARLSGVHRETISRIVNDRSGIGEDVAPKLADALGVRLDVLLLPEEDERDSRRDLHRRLQEVEDDRDWLFDVVRRLLTHLDKAGIGAPALPAAPRSRRVARPANDESS